MIYIWTRPRTILVISVAALWGMSGCTAPAENYEAQSMDYVVTLHENKGTLNCLALSPDGKYLACSNSTGYPHVDHTITVVDIDNKREHIVLKQESPASTLAFSPTGAILASGGGIAITYVQDKGQVRGVRGAEDMRLRLWNTTTWKEQALLEGHTSTIRHVAFSPDSKMLASAANSGDDRVIVWDASRLRQRFALEHNLFVIERIRFSPDGAMLAGVGSKGPITLWDVGTGKKIWSVEAHKNPNSGVISVSDVAFGQDSKTLVTTGHDRTVRVWEVMSKKETAVLRGSEDPRDLLTSIAYSPDGKLLVAGSARSTKEPGEVFVWETETWKRLARLKSTQKGVQSVQFSPDGRSLVVGCCGSDGFVELWNMGKVLHPKHSR